MQSYLAPPRPLKATTDKLFWASKASAHSKIDGNDNSYLVRSQHTKGTIDVVKIKDTKRVAEAPHPAFVYSAEMSGSLVVAQSPCARVCARARVRMCACALAQAQQSLVLLRGIRPLQPHLVAQSRFPPRVSPCSVALPKGFSAKAQPGLSTMGYIRNLKIYLSYISLLSWELLTAVFRMHMLNFLSSEFL